MKNQGQISFCKCIIDTRSLTWCNSDNGVIIAVPFPSPPDLLRAFFLSTVNNVPVYPTIITGVFQRFSSIWGSNEYRGLCSCSHLHAMRACTVQVSWGCAHTWCLGTVPEYKASTLFSGTLGYLCTSVFCVWTRRFYCPVLRYQCSGIKCEQGEICKDAYDLIHPTRTGMHMCS